MYPAILLVAFQVLLTFLNAEPEYPRDVAKWQEVPVPPKSDTGARQVWSYAANYSPHGWRVYLDGNRVFARLATEKSPERKDGPKFIPRAGGFRRARAYAAVDDGWLVGFNDGEFGAALYWFSIDGKRNYKVSDHQVVDFYSLKDGLYAIEGLAHLTTSRGSVIRIARSKPGAQWRATTVVELPFAPYSVSVRRDGTALITLSDAVVSLDNDHKLVLSLKDAPWNVLYPNSSVLQPGEEKLYVGMRQFVGEFDLKSKKLRLLVPSNQFLNKLPRYEEESIRKQYGGGR